MEQFVNYLGFILSISSILLSCAVYVLFEKELKRKREKRARKEKEKEKKEFLEANKEFIEKNFKGKAPSVGLLSAVVLSILGNNDQSKELSNNTDNSDMD